MNKLFQKSLRESLHVHCPLRPEQDRSIEGKNLKKEITSSTPFWGRESMDYWNFGGEGEVEVRKRDMLHLYTWSGTDHWPDTEVHAHNAVDGAYVTFGGYIPKLDVSGPGLSVGNRICFEIRPECEGNRNLIVRVGFTNDGVIKIPDAYSREGYNAMNSKNHEWNGCVWEIDAIARDRIEKISFNIHRYGKGASTGDSMYLELKDIHPQEVEPNVIHGWQCSKERAVYSATGYFTDSDKTAIMDTDMETFEIVHATDGSVAHRDDTKRVQGQAGKFGMVDFAELRTDGEYRIRFDSTGTETFHIGQDILVPGLRKLINFLHYERCGYPVPNCHGACRQDVYANHNGAKMIFNGDQHSAVDISQQTMRSVEILDIMMASTKEVRKFDEMLYLGMMEEANWGLDFILRMRFGDGYRTSHAALRRWTGESMSNMDDVTADVNNRFSENSVFVAVEASVTEAFGERDPELTRKCPDMAEEDFMFADERFRKVGLEEPHMVEHIAGVSFSQYYSAATWAAARLYKMIKEDQFVAPAKEYTDRVMACWETGDETPMNGYFYRGETKKHIVRFSHQARDHVFVMALAEIYETLKGHERAKAWEQAVKLRGEYSKKPKVYTQPYGMFPASIHHIFEVDDRAISDALHPTAEYETEKANYKEQLENSIGPGNGYYIRRFPVWFSYRGDSAIQLPVRKAASILGQYFGDKELIEISREQLYWALGKNPSTQSLTYGEGNNYGQKHAALLGETVGEVPVGIRAGRNEDLPYWPQVSVAIYREVWTTSPGRFMVIVADVI